MRLSPRPPKAKPTQNIDYLTCGLAEFEKRVDPRPHRQGRERAKARGVKMRRKPKLTDHQKREAIRRRDLLDEPVREIARSYNVSHSTISRLRA